MIAGRPAPDSGRVSITRLASESHPLSEREASSLSRLETGSPRNQRRKRSCVRLLFRGFPSAKV